MRTIAVTCAFVVGTVVGSAAQQPPAPASSPDQGTDRPSGLVPEPHALSHAVDFASEWLRTSTLARFDVAHSREGWELSFRLSDPFRLSRRSLRMTTIPFVP